MTNEKNIVLPFFPIPVAGETLYSLVSRFVARTGMPAAQLLMLLINQRRRIALLSVLPSNIGLIPMVLPIGHPWRDGEYIVRNNTALPYYLYFDSKQERDSYIAAVAKAKSTQSLIVSLGLIYYPSAVIPKHPQFCQHCVEEAQKSFGFSYFKREHQLPCVAVCWRHGSLLYHGCEVCGTFPVGHRGLNMSDRCLCEGETRKLLHAFPGLPSNLEPLLWIARQSAFMLTKATSCNDVRKKLKMSALRKGLGKGSRIHQKKLACAIEERFGSEVLNWLRAPVWRDGRPASWVRSFFHSPHNRKTNMHILLVVGALFDSIDEFERVPENPDPSEIVSEKKCAVTFQKLFEKETNGSSNLPSKDAISDLINKKYDVYRMAKHFGCSKARIRAEILRHNLRLSLSEDLINKFGKVKINSIRKGLRAGVFKTEICRRYGCTSWELSLIELDEPGLNNIYHKSMASTRHEKHRKILTEFVSKNKGVTRADIFRKLRITYQYLLTHDKEWFYAQVPLKPRHNLLRKNTRDWDLIDKQKAEELEFFFTEEFAREKPEWVTKKRALKRIGISALQLKSNARFQVVKEALRLNCESQSDFHKRRLKWAIIKLALKEKMFSFSALRRIACLNSKALQSHWEFILDILQQHNVKIYGKGAFMFGRQMRSGQVSS